MGANTISLCEITRAEDTLFYEWLDLYETAFPPCEKLLVSSIIKMLGEKEDHSGSSHHLAAILNENKSFAGLILHENIPKAGVALLWYLAIKPEYRDKGLGSLAYQQLIHQLDSSVVKALLYEVEIPNNSSANEAERRICFYQRQGARLLKGINYLQYIGLHHPPTPMYLMVHPIQPLTALESFKLCKSFFGEAVNKCGALELQ